MALKKNTVLEAEHVIFNMLYIVPNVKNIHMANVMKNIVKTSGLMGQEAQKLLIKLRTIRFDMGCKGVDMSFEEVYLQTS